MITTNRGAGVKTPTSWWQWSQFLFHGCQWGAAAVLWGCAFIALPENLCRELLGDAQTWVMLSMQAGGIPTCLIQLSSLPSEGQHWPWARPRSLKKLWPTHDDPKEEQQCGTSCTLAGDSHPMGLHTLSSRAHSFPVFLTLTVVLPLWRFISCWFFQLRHGRWKRPTGFELSAKNSSWILRFGWMTLRISVFKSGASLGQSSLIPTADGTQP